MQAGCFGSKPPCAGDDCVDADPSFPGTQPAEDALRWEDCQGFIGVVDGPRADAERRLPSGFASEGRTPLTATYVFEFLECRSASTTSRTWANASFFHLGLRVRPSEGGSHPATFELLLVVDQADVGSFLAEKAVPAQPGGLTVSQGPSVAGSSSWSLRVTQGDLRIETEYWTRPGETAGSTARFERWFSLDQGTAFLEEERTYTFDALPQHGGVLRSENAPIDANLPWVGQSYATAGLKWTLPVEGR